MVTFSMTFTDPYSGFQGHGIFEVEYLISHIIFVLRTKLLQDTTRKPYLSYGIVPCLVTLTDL